jgi:F-type H+-transporting ATPase subunit O
VQLLSLIGGVGGEAGKAVKNLLQIMSENGRLGKWDGVQSAFERLMRAHKGEIDVVVTSAQVLSPAQLLYCAFGIRTDG